MGQLGDGLGQFVGRQRPGRNDTEAFSRDFGDLLVKDADVGMTFERLGNLE